jgi:hypothetical protein
MIGNPKTLNFLCLKKRIDVKTGECHTGLAFFKFCDVATLFIIHKRNYQIWLQVREEK